MPIALERRHFLQAAAATAGSLALTRNSSTQQARAKLYEISLAQWSLNRQFFGFLGRGRAGNAEKLDPQDFAIIAK